MTAGAAVPLATIVTGANTHDVAQLMPLITSIPTLRDLLGRRRSRPTAVLGNRAYDSTAHRPELRRHRVLSLIARRNFGHAILTLPIDEEFRV